MRGTVLLLLTVAVAQASVSVTRTSSTEMHPSAMEIEVQLPDSNKKIRIPLTKTDDFENIPVTVAENGVSRTFSSHQIHHASHAHYRDIETKSVISVRHVNGQRRISGHVMHETTSYFLEPLSEASHSVTENVASPLFIARKVRTPKLRAHQKGKTASPKYNVELRLLLDSTVWQAFKAIYETESETLTELHYYYSHILNGISTAFRNIGTPSINVTCVGMTISKTLTDDAWMAGEVTEGKKILKAMSSYIVGKTADHFMAFTRMDISSDGSFSVCGMAYLGGVCKSTKVSINEDQGLQSWGTAAHELGHNLGSHHDSSGNTCSPDTKNIMAPSRGVYSLTDVANSYRFSACSVFYMTRHLSSLRSPNCLTSELQPRYANSPVNVREGARLTLDQVCRLAMPNSPGKLFVSTEDFIRPATICARIFCHTNPMKAISLGGMRAPVGTPCGDRKSCNWNGECTADSTAPSADETCFWGDSWSNCATWKTYIENKWTSCTESTKKGCCRSLASLC